MMKCFVGLDAADEVLFDFHIHQCTTLALVDAQTAEVKSIKLH